MKKTLTKGKKELLIKDLLLRTQTDVLVKVPGEDEPKELRKMVRWMITFGRAKSLEDCLTGLIPYLRPFSDMTKNEREELYKIGWRADELDENRPWAHNGDIWSILDGIWYLVSHYFDIYGLIEKDLAIKAKEGVQYKGEITMATIITLIASFCLIIIAIGIKINSKKQRKMLKIL